MPLAAVRTVVLVDPPVLVLVHFARLDTAEHGMALPARVLELWAGKKKREKVELVIELIN